MMMGSWEHEAKRRHYRSRRPPTAAELAITPETAFAEPVNIRLSGWTYRADYCLRLLREQNTPFDEIGQRLGCSGTAAQVRAGRLKVSGRPANRRPPTAEDLAITAETAFLEPVNVQLDGWTYRATYCLRLLREQNTSYKEIGQRLGCTGCAAERRARRLKLPKPIRRAVGHQRSPTGRRRILISFDEATFLEIRERAMQYGGSFAEEVRLLVEWGLETANMEERDEPTRQPAFHHHLD